jgi:hypothetical protein
MVDIISDKVPQGSYAFNLGVGFIIRGYNDALYHDSGVPDTWEVKIVNPEGTVLTKTSGLVFPNPAVPLILFPVVSGDFDREGNYSYQVTKTTGGLRLKSEVGIFTVEASAPPL